MMKNVKLKVNIPVIMHKFHQFEPIPFNVITN